MINLTSGLIEIQSELDLRGTVLLLSHGVFVSYILSQSASQAMSH